MPSKSKSQQRFMGMVRAAQKGELENPSKSVKKAAKSMDKDDVDDFASTKHKGLPNKVKREQRVRELIKKMVREMMDEGFNLKSGMSEPVANAINSQSKSINASTDVGGDEEEVEESRVKLASKKDVNFHGNIAQLVGKKHSMGLDKKSLLMLLKALRQHASLTFNEGKLNEAKVITLPNGVKVKISFGKVTLIDRRGKIELDRGELQKFGDAIKKHMGIREDFGGALKKEDRKKFDNMRRKQSEVLGYELTGVDDMKVETDDATVHEAKERNYKEEYKKYGSSKKAKKYRAELNAYNRKKGTYGNGDGKDASHKGGKIVGFEEQSKNRGRAEKSRLKKEDLSNQFKKKIQKYQDLLNKEREALKRHRKIKKSKNEGKLNEAKETIFDVAHRVLKNKSMENYKSSKGKVKLDMQTANLLVKVFKKVNPKMKKILSDLGYKNPAQLVQTLWAVVK